MEWILILEPLLFYLVGLFIGCKLGQRGKERLIMAQYIDKSALVEEIEKLKNEALQKKEQCKSKGLSKIAYQIAAYNKILSILDTLEVKEVEETISIAYVVTRSEEHSDYVEKVFFDEDKAQEYCDQFKGNENEYARHITKVEVTL